ncbi:hypothetical protein LOAG_05503 [Loa loa]|uniref:Caprin-1_dimer domain-containing protein n=1 Tax=Loa loa TaxID=7209 RepID=A0A1I7W4M5_LOALO|nr:hypothetical protein LOAG_05503 [Loa loa]EFO22982.1 hypothetical protein LOAG_05503 [Loa loa]
MEKRMQQLSLNDTSSDKNKTNQKGFNSRSKSGNKFWETRALINKRINELEADYIELSKQKSSLDYDDDNLTDDYVKLNMRINDVKDQLIIMDELNKVHLSDVKKIQRAMNKQRMRNKKNLINRMEDFQRYKELLSLMQNCEVKEAFRSKTNGAIKLTEDELDYLRWLNEEFHPSINSVENNAIWRRKLHESTLKAMEITTGSNKEIYNSWTGSDTKRLLERISNCGFFKSRTMWVNMEIFNRINASTFLPFGPYYPHPYYTYYYNHENAFDTDQKSNAEMTLNANNVTNCNDQSLNNNLATNSNVQQNNLRTENNGSGAEAKIKENYKFVKRSDKPDDYYLCFNYYPARFTSDVIIPPPLARRPPPGIYRCDI